MRTLLFFILFALVLRAPAHCQGTTKRALQASGDTVYVVQTTTVISAVGSVLVDKNSRPYIGYGEAIVAMLADSLAAQRARTSLLAQLAQQDSAVAQYGRLLGAARKLDAPVGYTSFIQKSLYNAQTNRTHLRGAILSAAPKNQRSGTESRAERSGLRFDGCKARSSGTAARQVRGRVFSGLPGRHLEG